MASPTLARGTGDSGSFRKDRLTVKKLFLVALFLPPALSFLVASAAAQEEIKQVGCDPTGPKNHCPGDECHCVESTLEIVFDSAESTNSTLTYNQFEAGMEIEMWQIAHIVTDGV
jgi:hypothetical protein